MIEPELYESVKVFKELFDNMGSGVVIYETEDNGNTFIIKEMNKAGLIFCQVRKKDIIRKNILNIFPGVKEFGLFKVLQRVWKTGKPEHFPTAFYQDDRIAGWTENYVYKLPSGKIVAIFEEQTERVEAIENYKKRVEFEKTISIISSRLVNPLNIDEAINSSLKDIGTLSKASRSYLFLFNEKNGTMSNTHEWCAEGVDPQIEKIQNVAIKPFSWSINKLKKEEILNIDKVKDLPPEASAEKEEFSRENIKSLIFLPVKIGEEVGGFIGFDNVRASEKWSEENLNLLKLSSDIIGNALKRINTEQELQEFNKELKQRVKERTNKLKESEEKFRALFKNHPVPIYVWQYFDNDFKLIDYNAKAYEITEGGVKKFLGLKSSELYKDNIEIINDLNRCFKEKVIISKEMHYVYQTVRKEKILYVTYAFIPPDLVLVHTEDITVRKKMEEDLQKSEIEKSVILETISEHILFQTLDNTILWLNKAAADSVNSTPEQLIGRKCYQIWNAREEPCEGCPIRKSLKTNQPEINEMNTPDGRFWIVAGYPVRDKDDNVIGVVEVTRNITEQKIAEQKLKESEKKYRTAYDQANLYKDLFAHDINNILQNIQSSVELSSLYLNNPEKLRTIRELYGIVNEQVYRAKKLINNVRKITQIDESDIILEKVEINRVLKKAIEFLKSSFQARNININVNTSDKTIYVLADDLLLDVFDNILINAVRHNDKPKIEIDININNEQVENKNYIKMEFKDNGVGISDYRKKSIFEKRTWKNQKSKGLGLGLSLVKKIIDKYQGNIWVEDRIKGDYSQGSNFIVIIPSNL